MGAQIAPAWQTIRHTSDMPMAKHLFTKLLKTNLQQGAEGRDYF